MQPGSVFLQACHKPLAGALQITEHSDDVRNPRSFQDHVHDWNCAHQNNVSPPFSKRLCTPHQNTDADRGKEIYLYQIDDDEGFFGGGLDRQTKVDGFRSLYIHPPFEADSLNSVLNLLH